MPLNMSLATNPEAYSPCVQIETKQPHIQLVMKSENEAVHILFDKIAVLLCSRPGPKPAPISPAFPAPELDTTPAPLASDRLVALGILTKCLRTDRLRLY